MEDNPKLTKNQIISLLNVLNNKLKERSLYGEISIVGGAVMCLVYDARPSTKDIDAIFKPKSELYNISKEVASEFNIPENWLNDGVKGFIHKGEFKPYKKLSNLIINVASAEFMFALKCFASRYGPESEDINDIKFLARFLDIKNSNEAINVIIRFIPEKLILPKTRYFLMEILGE